MVQPEISNFMGLETRGVRMHFFPFCRRDAGEMSACLRCELVVATKAVRK